MTEKVTFNQKFLDTIDEFYIKERDEEQKERTKKKIEAGTLGKRGFSPSFISTHECGRAWFLHYIKFAPKGDFIDGKKQRIFNIGSQIHDRIQKLLVKYELATEDCIEVRLNNKEYEVRGFVDGVIANKQYVLEIKSMNTRNFAKHKKSKAPKPEHIRQANLYMWLLDIDYAIIYYENKDNSDHLAWKCERDEEIIEDLQDYIRDTQALASEVPDEYENQDVIDQMPEARYRSSNFECKYCDWKVFCQENMSEKTEEEKNDILKSGGMIVEIL